MDFCFRKVSKPVIATGALALVTCFMGVPVMQGQATAQQPAATGQQPAATTKNYKDHDEYDLFSKITQTTDPKARLQLLNTWQDKYPTSDYAPERLQYFVVTLQQLAATDPTQRQALIDKCKDQLKADPSNFRANYLISVWGPAVGGANPSPDLLSTVETSAKAAISGADTAFADDKKPAPVSATDWTKAKIQGVSIAHNALAWVDTSKKDMAGAESEYRASLTANPEQGNISAVLAKLLIDSKDDKKYPDALFEYARAGEYTGPSALPADTKTKLLAYFNDAYTKYHGSADGASAILDQAKTSALPPTGFSIVSAQATANAAADKVNARMGTDPGFKLWYAIESQLKSDQGESFFSSNVKDAEIPGGAQGVKTFTGTVITADPSKITLGVEDPAVPDTTILFSAPLRDTEAAKIKVGDKMDFGGVVESFTKDPYMLTFKDPTIPGIVTTTAAKTGKKHK